MAQLSIDQQVIGCQRPSPILSSLAVMKVTGNPGPISLLA